MFEVILFDAEARRLLERAPERLSRYFLLLLDRAGRAMRDKVRDNIRTEGATFSDKWAPPSKWIVAKKGVRKALSGQERRVHFRVRAGRAEIYHESDGDWTIDQHHRGFTVPASGERVTLYDLVRPRALDGYRWNTFSFVSKRASKVPARRIWPTERYVHRALQSIVKEWASGVIPALKA